MWRFEWHSKDFLTDLLPGDEFAKEAIGEERVHLAEGARGGRDYRARYFITIRGKLARLKYYPCPQNARFNVVPGILFIDFKDKRRTLVERIRFQPWGTSRSTAEKVDVKRVQGADTRSARAATRQTRLSRPEQPEFRHALERAYGARCCITGCDVEAALEAAHITPYNRSRRENATNGLLLRADLHALFDSGHLAINPSTRRIHFSPEALTWAEYSRLHRRVKLREPQRGYDDAAPATLGLRRRWKQFRAQHAA